MELVAGGSLVYPGSARCKPQAQFNNWQWLSVAHSRLGLTQKTASMRQSCIELLFFNYFLLKNILVISKQFHHKKHSPNLFLFQGLPSTPLLLPIRMPRQAGTRCKQSTVPGCQQTWEQPALSEPTETHREAAVTAPPASPR